MRTLIVGARGMLGSEVVRRLQGTDVTAVDLPELDITDCSAVQRLAADVRPEVIINCAAYTDVDGSESHRDEAFAANAAGPRHLAEAARAADALLLHLSTDFVFDGTKRRPYLEDDPPSPLSVYGASKLAGEAAVRAVGGRHLIVRTSWLFGPGGKNFVTAVLRRARETGALRVVNDQTGSPTYAKDLAEALLVAVEHHLSGTYHLCNGGVTTWYDLAREAVALAGAAATVTPITTADWPRAARVPAYSVLSCEKARQDAGIALRPWQEALAEFVRLQTAGEPCPA